MDFQIYAIEFVLIDDFYAFLPLFLTKSANRRIVLHNVVVPLVELTMLVCVCETGCYIGTTPTKLISIT